MPILEFAIVLQSIGEEAEGIFNQVIRNCTESNEYTSNQHGLEDGIDKHTRMKLVLESAGRLRKHHVVHVAEEPTVKAVSVN